MQLSALPTKIPAIWANAAGASYITYPVPTPSQQGVTNGAASFTDGFPPNCFIPYASGGAGPFGKDFNGILKQATAGLQWSQAGGPWVYDGTFQSTIGGYPNGAIIMSATTTGKYWQSTVDNNLTNPDTGGAGWLLFPPALPPAATSKLTAVLTSAGAAITFTADYVSVATAIGGSSFVLANYSQTLNTATTGAGGMDTGLAPVSGFVSVYAIYNSTSSGTSILGTTACQTSTYTGSNLPSGYTASALIGIWPTNGSRQLIAGAFVDRQFSYANPTPNGALNAGTATVITAISLSSLVPAVARTVNVTGAAITSSSIAGQYAVFTSVAGATSLPVIVQCFVSSLENYASYVSFPLITAQTVYYIVSGAGAQASLNVNGYSI